MAAQNTPHSAIRTANRTLLSNHFQRILATRWSEPTAWPNQWADGDLIQPNQANQNGGNGAANDLHAVIVAEIRGGGKRGFVWADRQP
jgi:hypothetical protein